MTYNNPIIPGFYPDPSICKKGDTYYLVCSSFNYFPGVPLFESKDLINWTLIGHVISRNEQLDLTNAGNAGGVYAPTIRCHNGRFYMVTTHVAKKHFYMYTDDIYGSWSQPIWVDQEGIDPSLYFEGDTTYFMSNGHDQTGRPTVLQCEINIESGEKLTETQEIWHGTGGRYLEAPHLYLIDGTYYLVASEGGTEYGHMIVVARGKTPYGPFENDPKNPILTNRNLGGHVIQGAGHGDLICDEKGNWWLPHLAFRQISRYEMHHHLGREVYLVPLIINADGWFETTTGGITPVTVETDRLSADFKQNKRPVYTFKGGNWEKEWAYIRNPFFENYHIAPGVLKLVATDKTLDEEALSPTFLGLRQRGMHGYVQVDLELLACEGGLSLYMNESHHYEFGVIKKDGETVLMKRRRIGDLVNCEQKIINGDNVKLRIDFTNQAYYFNAIVDDVEIDFGSGKVKYLSKEVADGFTGVFMGLYAQGHHTGMNPTAIFTNFECGYDPEEEVGNVWRD